MSLIDTYDLATIGQNSTNTYTRASNGILVDIAIIPIPPAPPRPGGGSSGPYKKEEEEKERKKITVTVTIEGKKYTESVIVEDRPDLSVDDIDVDVQPTNDKPKITITVK